MSKYMSTIFVDILQMRPTIPLIMNRGLYMAHIGECAVGLPDAVSKTVKVVGQNIRLARKRRGWTLEAMAGSMRVTRKTLSRLESGDPAVGLAVMATALLLLGMLPDLEQLAAPDSDTVGQFHERQRLPQRVRAKRKSTDDLDF